MKQKERVQWWFDLGAQIVCGGAEGNPRNPLKRSGSGQGSYTRDFHISIDTVPHGPHVLAWGVRFTHDGTLIAVDVDVKRCGPEVVEPEALKRAAEIIAKLPPTYWERTDTGGLHFFYLRPPGWAPQPGPGKLSRNYADKSGNELFFADVWLRTAPSPGIEIENDQTPAMLSVAEIEWLLGEFAPPVVVPSTPIRTPLRALAPSADPSPIERAVQSLEASGGLPAVLARFGWADLGQGEYLRPGWGADHPGERGGKSARINESGRLMVWTTSTPLPTGSSGTRPPTYDALDVIAHYNHGGDRWAAAKAVIDWSPGRGGVAAIVAPRRSTLPKINRAVFKCDPDHKTRDEYAARRGWSLDVLDAIGARVRLVQYLSDEWAEMFCVPVYKPNRLVGVVGIEIGGGGWFAVREPMAPLGLAAVRSGDIVAIVATNDDYLTMLTLRAADDRLPLPISGEEWRSGWAKPLAKALLPTATSVIVVGEQRPVLADCAAFGVAVRLAPKVTYASEPISLTDWAVGLAPGCTVEETAAELVDRIAEASVGADEVAVVA